MGIGGITYTDRKGRSRPLDVSSIEDLKGLLGQAQRQQVPRQRVTPPLPQMGAPTRHDVETMPGSSVVNTRSGLALKGEENDPTVAGNKVYSSVDGTKGFHSLDEVDPHADGRRVGAPFGCDDDDAVADFIEGFDGESFRAPVLSRLKLHIDEVTGQLTLFEYQKELTASKGRRVYGVSGESRRVVGTWFPGKAEPNDGARFHFSYNKEDDGNGGTTVTIGDGAVQIGGYTYFVEHDEVDNMSGGTQYICVVVNLAGGSATFRAYASTAALNQAQGDMSKYIFPLYKVVDYAITMDYRPMPNAGSWEIAESVSNGGSSS